MSESVSDHIVEELLLTVSDPKVQAKEDKFLAGLMPELLRIHDDNLRSFVRAVLLRAPSLWKASNSGGMPDETTPLGTVIHTARVARVVLALAESEQRETWERDVLLAGALLHDTTRGVGTYDAFHVYTVDGLVRWVQAEDRQAEPKGASTTLLLDDGTVEAILRLIRCHKGSWSPIPETVPVTEHEWLLADAHFLAEQLHELVDDTVQEWRWGS